MSARAQPVSDTSFTIWSAYNKIRNQYPGIRIAAEINPGLFISEKNIPYSHLPARDLLLDVFSPSGRHHNKHTAIIIIHGGGWRSGNRMQHHALAQRLALLGYTCFTPEYRLSGEALFPAAILDIKAAVSWVRTNAAAYHTDTSRIVIMGFSAGGELAAFMGVTNNNVSFTNQPDSAFKSIVNAVVDIDGTLSFVHPESREGDDSKKLSAATQWLGVPKKDSIDLWTRASPLTYVSKYTAPTLFINSSVPAMHAGRTDYCEVLTKNNIPCVIHELPGTPHTFCLFEPWIDETVKLADEFLSGLFHLQ